MSEVQMSPDQIVEAMPKYLIPEKAGGTKATIVFDLSGENAGKWWVKIHDGQAESPLPGDQPPKNNSPSPATGVVQSKPTMPSTTQRSFPVLRS